jgi:hypothetical protein
MPRIELRLTPELHEYILQYKPKSLSLPAFCSLLIEQTANRVLDPSGTLGLASASEASPSSSTSIEEELTNKSNKTKTRARVRESDPFKAKAVSSDLVPPDLLDCQQLLPEFWAVKKGVRSEGVWSRVCGKLRGWTPEQRKEALERAIASGWGDVFEPPSIRTSAGQPGGYVDSISRDRQTRDNFLAMFRSTEEAA